ncbi:MAG: hypothetical protein ACLFQ6_10900, partial [Candidatus Sumerlaeia bacterium]
MSSRRSSEWKLVFVLAAFTTVLSALPMWLGVAKSPPYTRFLYSSYPWDSNQYFAFMRIGYEGEWRFTNLLTSEEHPRIVLMPFYVALGHVAGWRADLAGRGEIDAPLAYRFIPETYHNARMVLSFAFVWALYALLRQLTRNRSLRVWMMLFVILAGGWNLASGIMTEAHVLSSLIQFPHFTFSLILIALSLAAFLAVFRKEWTGRSISARWLSVWYGAAALCGFGLAWVHPFDLPPLVLLGGALCLWSWIAKKRMPLRLGGLVFIFFLFAAVPSLYQWRVSRSHPVFEAIHASNNMPWSHWWMPLWQLEVLLLLGLGGAWFCWKKRQRPEYVFLLLWIGIGTAILWTPVSFQRRLVEGLPIALALGAAVLARCVFLLLRNNKHISLKNGRFIAYGLILLILLPKTVVVLTHRATENFAKADEYYFLPELEAEALYWLDRNSTRDDVVWAPRWRGNRVPFLSGNRTYYGHGIMTVDSRRKKKETADFFSRNMSPEKYKALTGANNIRYVLVSRLDFPALGGAFDL